MPQPGQRLDHGARLDGFRIAYSLAGAAGAPVVAVLGGISANRHVAGRAGDASSEPTSASPTYNAGWWPAVAGVGRPLDLRSYRVLSIDYLGGPGETARTGASRTKGAAPNGAADTASSAAGGSADVPLITPADQARALAAVISTLGLGPIRGLIGASYGGAVGLAFAALYAEQVRRVLVIGAAHRSHPLATAVRVVQRRIVRRAVAAGDERGGLSLARALAMTTYRSDLEFEARFAGPPALDQPVPRFAVEDYLDHHGQRFASRFTAAQFLCLSQSLDLHFVDPASVRAAVTLVSIDPDTLAPRWQVEELARRIRGRSRLVRLDSPHGHDAFLTDHDAFGSIIADFLSEAELDS